MLQELIVGFTVVANFFVAGLVLHRNYRSATNILIATLSVLLASWTLFNYFALLPGPEETRLFWVRVVMVVTSPFGVVIFLLSTVFPGNKFTLHKKTTAGILALVWITAFLCTTELIFAKLINYSDGNFGLISGPGIILYATTLLVFMTWGFVRFFKKMRASTGLLRQQLKVVVFGIILSFTLLTLTNFIAVVLFNSIQLTYLGPPSTLIMIATMAYAVMRHRLLDIRLTITRSISFSLLLLTLAGIYSGLLFLAIRFLLRENITLSNTITSSLVAVPLLALFHSLRKIIEKYTEKLFFKNSYDLEEIVEELASAMSLTLNLEDLLRKVNATLISTLKTGTVQSIVINNEPEIFVNQTIKEDAQLYPQLLELIKIAQKSEENILIFDELEEVHFKQKMRDLNLEVVIALETKQKLLGGILLSAKKSGGSYGPQDIQLLRILAPQLSVAIQNAESYGKIRKFNITLEDEVDKATKKLRAANKQLKELDELKDEFISIASHELRTPMTAIKSYIWLALKKTKNKLSGKERYYLERSYSATERLIKLVNDMLNISRIESGRISLVPEKVDLMNLVAEVIDEVKARAEELGVTIILKDPEEDTDKNQVQVIADADKIKEVLINLIGNSLKFTPPKGTITVLFNKAEDKVVTKIVDTGSGIEPDFLPALFQKYGLIKGSYRTNQESTQGTGLGLYICKSIIELHEGKISAESEGKGTGSTFTFSLKQYDESELKRFKHMYKDKHDAGILESKL